MSEQVTTENGCVVLKRKEYEDLLTKSKLSDKQIAINYDYRFVYYYSDKTRGIEFNIGDKLVLSDGIRKQVWRIVDNIDRRFNEEMSKLEVIHKKDLCDEERKRIEELHEYRDQIRSKFSKLIWYKRLFFKESYI